MKKLIKENYLIKNTLILIITNIIIKILSLLNRIIITRVLGQDGISLYVLILPTIMLLLTISSFSLNISVSRIVATNQKTNKYSHKEILKKAIIIGLYSCLITLIIFSLTIRFISIYLLKQIDTFIPLIISMTIIPLAMFNSVFRGFFNGLDNIKTSSISTLIEQISRMLISIILFIIFIDKGIVFSVSITIISMTVGELISLIYNLISLKKHKLITNNMSSSNLITKDLLNLSFSQTLTHLASNITLFIEPIIYNYALTLNNYSNDEIMYRYSEVSAYALPLLSMFSFISMSIGTVVLPIISKNKYNEKAKSLTATAIKLSFIPSIILSVLLFYYGDKYMFFLYNSTNGSIFVKEYSFIYMFFYVTPILNSILIAHNKERKVLKISIITNIIKTLLIFLLSFIKIITYKSLFIAIIISNSIQLISTFIYLYKLIKFKILFKDIFLLIIIFSSTFYIVYLLKHFNVNYIISSIITCIIYLYIIKKSNLARLNNK